MSKYLLRKSTEDPLWWIFTDTENQVVCQFKEGEFEDNKKFTSIEDCHDVMILARVAREMTDYLVENHHEILFTSPTRIKEQARKSIGDELRAAREDLGITLRDLARMTGIAYNHISRIEQGKYNVTLDTLALLADALDIQLGFFCD